MIKYNNSTINDWNFDDANIVKVYHNGAVVYYKVTTSGGTPQYDVCYAVVADITQYQETEFVDVFDKKTEKWYKLNNLNQYEEYGVYGSGRNITYYNGKLTIDDGYEYMYSGSSWVNIGEVSGSSRVPQGYTEVEYVENTTTGTNYYIDTQFKPNQDTRVIVEAQASVLNNNPRMFGSGPWNGLAFVGNIENASPQKFYFKYGQTSSWWQTNVTADTNKHTFDLNKNSYYIDGVLANTASTTTFQLTTNLGIFNAPATSLFSDGETFIGKVFSCKIYDNGTLIRDLVPCYRDSDSKSGLYDVVNDVFYTAVNTSYNFTLGAETGSHAEYPLYYDEKSDPLDNLSFSSMTEANTYAYNNCVYDGMKATIDGDLYEFDSESGWTEVQYYYRVEDVTTSSQGGSGWTVTGSSTNNPNPSYYDDYSTAPNSTSYKFKVAKVTIFGYDSFTYYLRSSGYSGTYVLSTNIDEIQTTPTGMSYSTTSAITNTYNFNKAAGSQVNLSNYRRVTYNNLDKTVEHTFYVVYYNGYISNSTYADFTNATLLIPKDQSQENWEQVTFSASTNISGSTKSLYIDGNNSSSGGTNNFYSRWMVGLPNGSHSSYTNYSNYNYCPSVTSATFTSVDGGVRQVDYIYVPVSSKTLQFRLIDESGNTITTANTVYYNMNYDNGCGGSSSSSNVSFPRNQNVVNGGKFAFSSSSNRHYIYGYQPNITLNTSYFSDNYSTYFDIPYTKLNTEAVTITYTTYDPNDSETPTLNTVISWPYGNSGTSSTTLASYEVPYTYSYSISPNDKFSASTYEYTASQASRNVSLTLYPNNREFSTVADLEAYQYAWDGMIANVGDTKYKYEDGEWSEVSFITFDELLQTRTVTSGSCDNPFTPDISGVTKFRCHIQNANDKGSCCFLDFFSGSSNNAIFALKSNTDASFYTNKYGYSSIKAAANDTSCQWAYWIDQNTMEVDFNKLFGSTAHLNKYQTNINTSYFSFELQ